jgi:hypothetical protein
MRILSCVSVALALSAAGPLFGQSITGDLVVNVTDPSGSAVSGAKLSLIQVETNVRLDAQTDALGNYLFSQLKPGRFALEVSGPGFQKTNLTDIVITLGQRARVDVKLTVGTLTETVNVSAAAETLLNAESASVGQVITSAPIVELPLNGRNFIQLAQISADAAPVGIGTSPATSWTGRTDSTLSIAGGRETNNSFLVNGIETRNSRFGSAGLRPSTDAIEEFKGAALHLRRRVRPQFGGDQHHDSLRHERCASGLVRVSAQPQFRRERLFREPHRKQEAGIHSEQLRHGSRRSRVAARLQRQEQDFLGF